MNRRVNVIVSGIVQGVNFRRFIQLNARQLGVYGWVRNLPDGRVASCFEGETAAVSSLLDWCRSGPDWARVDHLAVRREEYRGEFDGFTIRR